jgi:hypothetical protein
VTRAATAIAQKYVDEQLKGPKGESKTLHVSPFGHVRPFSIPRG